MRWLTVLVISLFAVPLAATPSEAASDVVLRTDAASALFADGQLSSTYRSTRCLRIDWTNNSVSRLLGMSASVAGGLAPYLDLQVEVGAGGGYVSCSGFSGDVIYDGTLADFGAVHPSAAAQLTAKRITSTAGSATFRITMAVHRVNAAQSRTSSADFIFAALDEHRLPVPPSPQPTTVSPSPRGMTVSPSPKPTPHASTSVMPSPEPATAEPSPSRSDPDQAEPGPGSTKNDEPPGDDGALAAPTAEAAVPGANQKPGIDDDARLTGPQVTVPLTPRPEPKPAEDSPLRTILNAVGSVNKVVKEAAAVVQQAAAPVAKGVAWGVWSLPLLLLFLVLQNSIDARDPKLAEAPSYADMSLPFDDSYDVRPAVRGDLS